jgi:asparagine synthase (glutamine-hydrolysing)
VRALLGTGLVPRVLDRGGLLNYLSFGSAYDPLTLVEGIKSLPAGHSLTWRGGVLHESSYWDLVDVSVEANPTGFAGNEKEASASVQHTLEEAVRLQLVSDVPVGIFLSGGIDSSALVSILSKSGIKPSTFSIVFREADFSEAEYSRAVARKFHTDHHEITVSQQDVLRAIPDALRAMDLPTIDGANTYIVSREARAAGVKVALSGLGGDEVFAGYSSFRSVPRLERLASGLRYVPHAGRTPLAAVFAALSPTSDQNRKLASLIGDNGRVLHPYFLTRMLFTPGQRDRLCASVDEPVIQHAVTSQRATLERTVRLDPINRISYLESRCYMLNTLLRDADFMSMSQGLEIRVPLIDHQLAKRVLALPGEWKLNGSTPKKLLVNALEGALPQEIVHRPKRGFTLPFEHWLRSEFRAEVEPVLTREMGEGPLARLLSRTEVARIWNDFLQGETSWSRPWALYVLHRWCELHSLSS